MSRKTTILGLLCYSILTEQSYFSLAEEKNTANKEMFVYYSCFRRDDRPIYFVVLPLYLLYTIVILVSAKATSNAYETLYENSLQNSRVFWAFLQAEKDPKRCPLYTSYF